MTRRCSLKTLTAGSWRGRMRATEDVGQIWYMGRRVGQMTRDELVEVVGYLCGELQATRKSQAETFSAWRMCREARRR